MIERSKPNMLTFSCIDDEILISKAILRKLFQNLVPILRENL